MFTVIRSFLQEKGKENVQQKCEGVTPISHFATYADFIYTCIASFSAALSGLCLEHPKVVFDYGHSR
jgi:hypothetical protein